MPACKTGKSLLALLLILSGSGLLFAQSIEMPSMPAMPSAPSAPQLQMPSISNSNNGGNFYTPSVPTQTVNPKAKTSSASSGTGSKTETVISDGKTSTEQYSSIFGNNQTLTASDISTLYDSGLFSDLSSLQASNLAGYTTSTNTNFLLQQVLTSLDELKKEQKNVSAAEKQVLQNTQTDSQTFKTREPSILRFKINNYSITDSLTTVFFSETEPDGTFLLTADRIYYSNGKSFTETFYLLFKTIKSNGQTVTYQVQPTITQDVKNENSFVYKLATIHNLVAEKTGNLVVLHYSGDGLNADMLLDIDRK